MGSGVWIRCLILVGSSLLLIIPSAAQFLSVYNQAQQRGHGSHQQQIAVDVSGKIETGKEAGNTCDLPSWLEAVSWEVWCQADRGFVLQTLGPFCLGHGVMVLLPASLLNHYQHVPGLPSPTASLPSLLTSHGHLPLPLFFLPLPKS